MKKRILFCLLMLPISLLAQNVEFDKNSFKDQKTELKEALKNIDNGDKQLFAEPFPLYKEAIPFYEEANRFNPNNAMLNYKLGVCYINSNQKFKSIGFFEKAHTLNPAVSEDIRYYKGWGYQLVREWDKAIAEFNAFVTSANPKSQSVNIADASKRIKECNSGKKLDEKQIRVWIDNMGSNINTEYPEYGMIMNADGTEIYFTARRPTTTGGGKDETNSGWYEDIYYSTKKQGKWTPSTNLGEPINTKGHDATVALSPDGSKMLVYIDDKGDGNIYESVRRGETWSKPRKLDNEICSPYHESSAWYSSDGKKLYFISNRPLPGKKGEKDKDIYVATYNDEKKKWENVQRLPENVNSAYDEDGIFVHPDGKTIYFSSKGHNSMGGYDVFYTVLKPDGTWLDPVNVGAPVNTPDDDVFFTVTASGRYGYMTSYREDGYGEKDLYLITFLGEEKKPLMNTEDMPLANSEAPVSEKVVEPKISSGRGELALLKGVIYDDKTKKPIEAVIELIDNVTGKTLAEFSSDPVSGKYLVSLPAGKNYGIAVKSDGYLFHSENFDIPKEADYQEFNKDVYMKKIEVGEVIVLRNIFFDLNKYSLRPESQNELDRLTKLMKDNPSLRIQISGHTDSRGSAQLNKDLSANRAKAVVDYLVEKGIAKSRLESEGFGKDQPIVTDAEIAKMKSERLKEEAHQSNRRTEFKIISK